MRISTLMLALAFVAIQATGQNIVPNPSFENLNTPPCSWITSAGGFTGAVQNWTMPSDGSTDIFSNSVATTCYGHNMSTNASRMGQQNPRSGTRQSMILTYGAGCGFMPNYREYLQVQLTSPMVVGQTYNFSFYVSMGDESTLATNNIGVHFRTSSYYSATCFVIPLTPQFNSTAIITDKSGWVQISGSITASAAFNHIIIGNFFSNAATSTQTVAGGTSTNTRYYVDDVSVQVATVLPAPELALHGNRAATGEVNLDWEFSGSEAVNGWELQRSLDGETWEDIARPEGQVRRCTDSFAPRNRSFYRLRYADANGNFHVSNAVEVGAGGLLSYRIELAGNPTRKGETAYLRIANADAQLADLVITDANGATLVKKDDVELSELDFTPLPTEALRPGLYFVHVHTREGVLVKKFLVMD